MLKSAELIALTEMEISALSCSEGRKPDHSWWVESICQHFLRDTPKTWWTQQRRAGAQDRHRSKVTAALTVLQGVSGIRSWRMAKWSCIGIDVRRSPCCTEGNVNHCTCKLPLIPATYFPLSTNIIFWLLLLLIDLPVSTGCQEVSQTIELITLHSVPFYITHPSPPLCLTFLATLQQRTCPEGNPNSTSVPRACHAVQLTHPPTLTEKQAVGFGCPTLSCLPVKMFMGPYSQQRPAQAFDLFEFDLSEPKGVSMWKWLKSFSIVYWLDWV